MSNNFLINQSIIPTDTILVVGFSGGADSVCLLHQLNLLRKEKNITLIAAYLNHEWRQEAIHEEAFCKELCQSLNITYIIKKISELSYIPEKTGSKEDIARQARRHFFETIAQEYQAHAIALAHHQDDQIETFLIRIIRGTTIEGLGCIQEQDGLYIRPLLHASKSEILKYLEQNNYTYMHDSSNLSHDYLRNRIRHKAVPSLEECDHRFKKKCLDLIKNLQDTNAFIEAEIEKKYASIVQKNKLNHDDIDYKKLLTFEEYVQKKIIITWLINNNVRFNPSDNFLKEILRFCKQEKSSMHTVTDTWKIKKIKNMITIF